MLGIFIVVVVASLKVPVAVSNLFVLVTCGSSSDCPIDIALLFWQTCNNTCKLEKTSGFYLFAFEILVFKKYNTIETITLVAFSFYHGCLVQKAEAIDNLKTGNGFFTIIVGQ